MVYWTRFENPVTDIKIFYSIVEQDLCMKISVNGKLLELGQKYP
jgi:hypothetical protein